MLLCRARPQVPFERVPDLVAARRVLLKAGWALVPRHEVASLVVGHFRRAQPWLVLSSHLPACRMHTCNPLLIPDKVRLTLMQPPMKWAGASKSKSRLFSGRARCLGALKLFPHMLRFNYLVCRTGLSHSLVLTARRWAGTVAEEEADRLTPIVLSLAERCARTQALTLMR